MIDLPTCRTHKVAWFGCHGCQLAIAKELESLRRWKAWVLARLPDVLDAAHVRRGLGQDVYDLRLAVHDEIPDEGT